MKFYQGKTVFITGAGSGLGKEMAFLLAREKCSLLLTDINTEALAVVAGECERLGAKVFHRVADVTDRQEMLRLKAQSKIHAVDVVFANAGVGGINPAGQFSPEIDHKIMSINYFGLANTLSLFLPEMRDRKSGVLVGISSLASIRGLPEACSYSASKAAVNNFLESWRLDLKPYGIQVTCVRPGFIKTPMTNHDEFPLPFMLSAEETASKILKAVACKKKVYSLPWIMGSLSFLNKWMPVCLYDVVLPLLSPKSKQPKTPKIFGK